ncbi:hypothetical protein TNCV_2004201 [Trichonephila clavipes]|nr:hypothetical protein TNCV_2004201 [Trichonephila clavipes]
MFLAGHPSQGCFGLQSHCAPCYFFNQASFYPSDFSFSTPIQKFLQMLKHRLSNNNRISALITFTIIKDNKYEWVSGLSCLLNKWRKLIDGMNREIRFVFECSEPHRNLVMERVHYVRWDFQDIIWKTVINLNDGICFMVLDAGMGKHIEGITSNFKAS